MFVGVLPDERGVEHLAVGGVDHGDLPLLWGTVLETVMTLGAGRGAQRSRGEKEEEAKGRRDNNNI